MADAPPEQSTVWTRMLEDARLAVPMPRWFTVLRVIARSLIYGLVVMRIGLMPPSGVHSAVLWSITAVLWVVLAFSLVAELRHRRAKGDNWRIDTSDASFVFAPLFVLIGLPWIGLVLLLFGYILQLRRVSGGQVFVFALIGTIVVTALASLALMEVESKAQGSQLTTPFPAVRYTLSMLFRVSGVTLQGPVSEQGRMLMEGMQIASALLLSALYAGLLAFIVRPQPLPADPRIDQLLEQQAEILRRLDAAPPSPDERQ